MPDLPVNFKKNNNPQVQDENENSSQVPVQEQQEQQEGHQTKIVDGKFAQRRRAREIAVQFLYSLDTYPAQEFEQALEFFLGEDGNAADEIPAIKDYCRYLTRGVWTRQNEIDDVLVRVVTGWRPERISTVDRAILRLTIFEGFLARRLPFRSSIAEAIALAKIFGTNESLHFVNGVLSRVVAYFFPKSQKKHKKAF